MRSRVSTAINAMVWRVALIFTFSLIMLVIYVVGFDQQATRVGEDGQWPLILAIGVPVVYFGGRYVRSRLSSEITSPYATKLGWKMGSVGSWEWLRSDPFDSPGRPSSDGSMHGVWREYPAESIYYESTDDPTSFMFGYRVELVQIDTSFPTLELAQRGGRSDADRSDELDLESAEFNERFKVTTADRAYAHTILHPRMMERLLLPDARGLDITIEGDVVMTSRWTKARAPKGVEKRLAVLVDIANLIPAHAKTQYATKRSARAQLRPERLPEDANARAVTSGAAMALGAETVDPLYTEQPQSGRKNWIAWLAAAFLWTMIGAPVAILLAQWSLRAYRLRQSTNASLARKIRMWGYFTLPMTFLMIMIIWARWYTSSR